MRPLPEVTPATEWFWTSGADGVLRIQGCADCGGWCTRPVPVCPGCAGRSWAPTAVSGRATVAGYTVNQHRWHPDLDPPYALAVVALAEDPEVRLTTAVVGCEPTEVRIGQAVSVRFEQHDDVWLPLFEPTGEPDGPNPVPDPGPFTPRAPLGPDRFEHRSVLSGIGRSALGRRLMVDPLSLTVDACLGAVADAGLDTHDIDGLSTYPGPGGMGMSEGGVSALEEALRLHPTWINGGGDLPGPGGAVVAAMLAVSAGLCRHVLCFRTVWESTFAALGQRGPGGGRAAGQAAWRAPFGALSPANWIAMNANQYLHRYGAGRELLGWIALNGRANAARNPAAIYRDPMTMDDYLSARPITSPFGLYDCDVPCDGSTQSHGRQVLPSRPRASARGARARSPRVLESSPVTPWPEEAGPEANDKRATWAMHEAAREGARGGDEAARGGGGAVDRGEGDRDGVLAVRGSDGAAESGMWICGSGRRIFGRRRGRSRGRGGGSWTGSPCMGRSWRSAGGCAWMWSR